MLTSHISETMVNLGEGARASHLFFIPETKACMTEIFRVMKRSQSSIQEQSPPLPEGLDMPLLFKYFSTKIKHF